MNNIDELQRKIVELEYRLSVIEKFLDQPSALFHKEDESLMNSIRLDVVRQMQKKGMDTTVVKKRLGTRLYTED